jgi:hypothetical protein
MDDVFFGARHHRQSILISLTLTLRATFDRPDLVHRSAKE